MDTTTDSLEQKLRDLERIFVSKLPGKLEEINAVNVRFVAAPDAQENFATLHRLLHALAGSAGTFGFHEVGQNARILESEMKAHAHDATWKIEQSRDFSERVARFVEGAMPK